MAETDIVEGTIRYVMETQPLQIRVETTAGMRHFKLDQATEIIGSGAKVDRNRLSPGMAVKIFNPKQQTGMEVPIRVEVIGTRAMSHGRSGENVARDDAPAPTTETPQTPDSVAMPPPTKPDP